MSKMIRHCGSRLVEPHELESIPTPAPMGARHMPVAHADTRGALVSSLDALGLGVARETCAVSGPNGEDLFGLLLLEPRETLEGDAANSGRDVLKRLLATDVKSERVKDAIVRDPNGWEVTEEYSPAVAYRNSMRQRFAFLAMYGANVTVCDNLSVWGGEPLGHFKNTSGQRLYANMMDCCSRVAGKLQTNQAYIDRLRGLSLTEGEARARMHEVFAAGSVPTQYLKPVWKAYSEPADDWTDCQGDHAWALYNAFTRSLKVEPLHTRLAHTAALLKHMPVPDLSEVPSDDVQPSA